MFRHKTQTRKEKETHAPPLNTLMERKKTPRSDPEYEKEKEKKRKEKKRKIVKTHKK